MRDLRRRLTGTVVLALAVALAGCAAAPLTCPDVRSEMERMHPTAVAPEPAAPIAECTFQRDVRCVPPFPTTAAWQMDPFSGCPRTIERWTYDLVAAAPQFSRAETRKRRLGPTAAAGCAATPSDGPCCYVQHSADACD